MENTQENNSGGPYENKSPIKNGLTDYRSNDNKPCIECGAFEGPGESYPHCTKCSIADLEWTLSEYGHHFSIGSKDMMRREIKELQTLQANKG